TGRLVGDALGTVRTNVSTLSSGVAPYFSWRWGDYAYNSVDPVDDMSIWSINEYAANYDSTTGYDYWGAQVMELIAPPPSIPISASSVAAGLSAVNVTVTGNAAYGTGGNGFYDGGANATNHISATVTGVTVNSTTYVDPTHVILNLNTVGAATGTHNVTITN